MAALVKPSENLKEEQVAAIDMLVAGRTVTEVAEHFGIHRNTVRRWRNSEDGSDYFDRMLKARMAECLPGLLNTVVDRATEPKAPLIGVVRAFESVANRAGHPEVKAVDPINNGAGLAIEINLDPPNQPKDITPDPALDQMKAEVESLRAELAKYKGVADGTT
ncbi:helix-turn-helix domain-containing protein [Ruegeria arenilitoris]|uniref:helix-turn-helix domain-containing protein n=1 Tax=Ruegeria arenilitoris TaxID=1173585 RepID=UPI00147C0179|nr:helix-turn-helix domain-containing protein [Ruegeria arenilitoris]